MGLRGAYHKSRIQRLVEDLKIWREERLPGTRAFQSKYDRVGVIVCKWLFQAVHDVQASSNFDYILPLMVRYARWHLALVIAYSCLPLAWAIPL